MTTQVCAAGSPLPLPGCGPVEQSTDCYVPSGRIGRLDLKGGCYTTYAVFRLAAADIAARGLEDAVRGLLLSRQHTVRSFLRSAYGCALGGREYFTPSHMTGAQADARDFLRILSRAVGLHKRMVRGH